MFGKQEKRNFSRLNVKIDGTLFKEGYEVPIKIANISEEGIGLRYNYKDCPSDFCVKKGEEFTVSFFDDSTKGLDIINNNMQQCTFKVIQVRNHTKHSYIGARLIDDEMNYPLYVSNKKVLKFTASIRFMDFMNA